MEKFFVMELNLKPSFHLFPTHTSEFMNYFLKVFFNVTRIDQV
jgi:hypothetical protein